MKGLGFLLCTAMYSLMAVVSSGTLAEHAIAQALGRDVAKEPLDHVELGRRGRSEMNMQARMLGEPFFDVRMLLKSA